MYFSSTNFVVRGVKCEITSLFKSKYGYLLQVKAVICPGLFFLKNNISANIWNLEKPNPLSQKAFNWLEDSQHDTLIGAWIWLILTWPYMGVVITYREYCTNQ